MYRDDEVITAIRQKDVGTILAAFFSSDLSFVQLNYRTETELWDYKQKCPSVSSSALEWAEISKDILAFHNTGKGGLLLFGISDKDYEVHDCVDAKHLDSKFFNDKIRKFVGDKLWVEFYSQSNKNKTITIGIAIVPPLQEQISIKRFQCNGPEKKGRRLFDQNGSAIRKNDSSFVLSPVEANEFELSRPSVLYREFEIDEPQFRLLSADYHEFVLRSKLCNEVIKGLQHSRSTSVCLIGIGGVGKTALATWAVKNAYKNADYDYIVSISAKDRELTPSGIQAISQKMTSLNDLLNVILDVIGFSEYKELEIDKKKTYVNDLLKGEKALLFIDNLETAADKDIVDFINNLPEPVKAIITTRRNVVTISSYPIEIGPLEGEEISRYISSLSELPEFAYCRALSNQEKERIGLAFNGIPLAIKWIIGKCKSSDELVAEAERMENGGHTSEELLEFSFRRVFDNMSETERKVMQVLAIVSDLPIEALVQGTGLKARSDEVIDALDSLVADTIIISYYDSETRAKKYRLLSLTQRFMQNSCIPPEEEKTIQRKLSNWYNAEDVIDVEERKLVSAMRQGGQNMGNALVAFAETAANKGDYSTAIRFYEAATTRDPQNWKVFWKYGEFFRHCEKSLAKAITQYETALKLSRNMKPSSELAKMLREFGIIYSQSGRPNAISRATEHLERAHNVLPHDPVCAKYLSEQYLKVGHYEKAISVLRPFENTTNDFQRQTLLPLLLKAYEKNRTKYMREIAELKAKL